MQMLYPVAAGRGQRRTEEGGDSWPHRGVKRKGWMHCAVDLAVLEGRTSRGDAVEVVVALMAEALVSDSVAADFAFAPCRRLS